jgi:hypothetical protein
VRLAVLPWLAGLVPAGLATKLYAGPLQSWVANSLGGVLYEVFWCLAVLAVAPGADGKRVGAGVFAVTSLLEVLQLWHPPWLQAIRGTFPGAALLGTTFVWSDFAYYAAGSHAGWGLISAIQAKSARRA